MARIISKCQNVQHALKHCLPWWFTQHGKCWFWDMSAQEMYIFRFWFLKISFWIALGKDNREASHFPKTGKLRLTNGPIKGNSHKWFQFQIRQSNLPETSSCRSRYNTRSRCKAKTRFWAWNLRPTATCFIIQHLRYPCQRWPLRQTPVRVLHRKSAITFRSQEDSLDFKSLFSQVAFPLINRTAESRTNPQRVTKWYLQIWIVTKHTQNLSFVKWILSYPLQTFWYKKLIKEVLLFPSRYFKRKF